MNSSMLRTILVAALAISGCESAYFSWWPCSSGDAVLRVRNFAITPDPVILNDYIMMALDTEVTGNVTYPLTLSMTVNKLTFFGWKIKIPCLSVDSGLPVGSCEYDVCSTLGYFEDKYGCPSEFTSNQLPCRCPFNAMTYSTANNMPIRLLADVNHLPMIIGSFLSGDYEIKVEVLDGNNRRAMCVEFRTKVNS